MKICVLSSVYALSPDDRHASFLVESHARLKARGHDIIVIAPSYRGLTSHVVDGVTVNRFRYFPRRWEQLTHGDGAPGRVGNPFYFLMTFPYIVSGMVMTLRLCRREGFDLIHVQWPFPHAVWGIAAKRFYNVPLVYTFHGAEILLAERFGFVRWILERSLRYSDAITCNSAFTAAKVARLTDKPISVLPYGATIEARARARRNEAMPGPRRLLFVGRLIPRKGLRYLVEAMPLIDPDLDVRLDVVGDGPELEGCERLAVELGVSDRVVFHGFVPNEGLQFLYAEADAFVLPSIVDAKGDTEGLGVVLIEAMSFRTPVVACDVGGISDVVQDGETGLLVPPKDPAALARAVTRVLTDRDLSESLAERGFERASMYFDWDRITDRLDQVYHEALGLRR